MAGKTYEKAPKAIVDRAARIMRTYHPDLTPLLPSDDENSKDRYEFRLELIVAYGKRDRYGMQTGPAITVGGYQALACVRITTLEERVAGRGDAVITLDGDRLKDWPDPTFDAILDHELTHLEIVEGKAGGPEYDDVGRIRLKMRPHDFQVGWFDEVAERHGDWSVEAVQARELATDRQMYFPGFDVKPKKKRSA